MSAGEDKRPIALVIGGSGSIGAAIADRLAGDDFRVIIASRFPPIGTYARQTIDITNYASCLAAAAAIQAAFGRLDWLINAASIAVEGLSGPFATADPSSFDAAARGSVTATFNLVHAMQPLLAASRGGVLLLTSDAALFASRNQATVGPTRAAIVNFVRNFALEAAAEGIRVNGISLSYVQGTAVARRLAEAGSRRIETAAKRAGLGLPDSEDVAALAVFLCSSGAKRITGQVISLNGGLSA